MPMTPEEFKAHMEKIMQGWDLETEHISADRIMCELLTFLGYGEGVKIFEDARKWYA